MASLFFQLNKSGAKGQALILPYRMRISLKIRDPKNDHGVLLVDLQNQKEEKKSREKIGIPLSTLKKR